MSTAGRGRSIFPENEFLISPPLFRGRHGSKNVWVAQTGLDEENLKGWARKVPYSYGERWEEEYECEQNKARETQRTKEKGQGGSKQSC